jgi:hypothetical protein
MSVQLVLVMDKVAAQSMSSVGRWKNYVRFEVFTAATMKNAVFMGIKAQFVPNRRHITYSLQSPAG